MNDDNKISLYSKIIVELAFVAVSFIYLYQLDKLNKELKKYTDISNAFEVATYKNDSAVWFVVFALIILVIAVICCIWYWKTLINTSEGTGAFLSLAIVATLMNTGIMWSIWVAINNPILRAVMVVFVFGAGAAYAMNSNN